MPKRSAFDAERLRQVLRAQHHVITRQQALLCGLPTSTLDRYIAPSGRWQRLLPGVYLALTGAATQDQLEMAALLYAGPRSLITGSAAVRRHQRHDRLLAHGIMPLHFPPKRIKADPSASSTTSGQRSSRDRVGRRCPSPRSRLTSGAVPRVRAVPPVSRRPPGSALCPPRTEPCGCGTRSARARASAGTRLRFSAPSGLIHPCRRSGRILISKTNR